MAAAVAAAGVLVGSAAGAVADGRPAWVTIDAAGTLEPGNRVLEVPDAFPVLPSAVSNGSYQTDPMACDTLSQLGFLAVVEGTLGSYSSTYDEHQTCSTPPAVLGVIRYSAGWGQMRQLVSASGPTDRTSTVFALHANGSLYRYRTVDSTGRSLRGYGVFPGFGAVKSVDLYAEDATKHVLLMNLAGGSLYQVTITKTATPTVTAVPIRTRSWQSIEQLMVFPASESFATGPNPPRRGVYVVGVDAETGAGYGYALGVPRGASTTIRSDGAVDGTYRGVITRGGVNTEQNRY